MRTVFIYALKDPDTGLVRYIGKADDPYKRLSVHLASREKNHRTNWIKSLLIKGKRPELEIIDEVSFEEWPMWEVAYIDFFREEGFPLVNSTLGGEGMLSPSTETISKITSKTRGLKRSEETRRKTSDSVRKSWALLSPEARKSRIDNQKKRGFGNQVGVSPPNKGRPCPTEQKIRISNTLKGRKKPVEHLAKLQAGSQRRWEEYHASKNV